MRSAVLTTALLLTAKKGSFGARPSFLSDDNELPEELVALLLEPVLLLLSRLSLQSSSLWHYQPMPDSRKQLKHPSVPNALPSGEREFLPSDPLVPPYPGRIIRIAF